MYAAQAGFELLAQEILLPQHHNWQRLQVWSAMPGFDLILS